MTYREHEQRRKARLWQRQYCGMYGYFVIISGDDGPRLAYKGTKYPLTGATATIEASLTQGSHTTAGRVIAGTLLAGPIGPIVGAVAKKSDAHLYVTVTLTDGTQVQGTFPAKQEAKARELVDNINTIGAMPVQ